ncbi:indoleamine 2,3-dioxygenase 2-like [Glandiceps talaboti]
MPLLDHDKLILPKQVAVPLWKVSERLGIKPSLCHSTLAVANWAVKDDKESPFDINNRKVIVSLPGGMDFEWFIIVTQEVDLAIAPSLKAVIDAQKATLVDDKQCVLQALETVASSLKRMKDALHRIHEKCRPEVFYNVLRVFLMGWDNSAFEEAGYPGGLIYEGISNNPEMCLGTSGAQSPSFQFIDAALAVEHNTKHEKFHENLREYMLPAHRELILALRRGPSIKSYVQSRADDILNNAYEKCIQAMSDLRTCHLQITVRYVIIPLNEAERREGRQNNVMDNGTGGSDMIVYLKSLRTDTQACSKETPTNK